MKTLTPDELCRNPSAMMALMASQAAAQARPAQAPTPDHPGTQPPPAFPWPEIRAFISTLVSQNAVAQNHQMARVMFEQKAPGVTQEQVDELEAQVRKLDATAVKLNETIETKLRAAAPPEPRIYVPR